MTELWYRIQRRYYKSSVCANGTSKTNGSSDIKQRSKPTVEYDTTLEEESHDGSADADTSQNHHDNSSSARAENPETKFLTEKPSSRSNNLWSKSEPDTRLPPSDSACSCSSSTVTVTVSPSNTHVSNVEVHSEPDGGRHSTSTLASSSVRLEPVDSGVELRPPDSNSQRSSGSWCVLDIQNCLVSDPVGSVQQEGQSQSSVKCDDRTSTSVTPQRSLHEDSRRGSRNSCQNSVRFATAKVRTENQITSADPALEQTNCDKRVACSVSRVPKHRVSYNETYPEPSGPRSHDKKCITMTSSSSSPTVRVSRTRERRHGEHRSSLRHSQNHSQTQSQSQEKGSVLAQSHHSRSAHPHSQDRNSASAQSRERPSSNSKPRNTHSVPSKSLDVPSHHRDRRSGSSQSRDKDTTRPRSKDKHSAPSTSLDVPSHSRDRRSGSSQPRDRDTSQSRSRERRSVSPRSQEAPYHSKDRRSASSQDRESTSSQCEERRSSPVQHRWKDLAEAMRRYRAQQARKENGRHGDGVGDDAEKQDQEKLVKIVFSNVCYVMPLRAGLPARQEEHLFDVSDLQHEPPLISKCGSLEVTFSYEAAKCKMTVTIHRAREIPAKDRGGANSTQVRLMMLPTKKQRYKTKVKEGQEPVYEETFVFTKVTPDEVPGMGLRFRLYGLERMRRERMIGESVIGFASLNLDEPTTHWVILEPRSNLSHGDSGFDVSSLSKSDSASSTQSLQHGGMPELLAGLAYNSTTGRLAVQVIKGSNFRNMAMNRAPDTYVKVTLMSPSGQELQRCKTSVRRGQPNPLFKETFMLQVPLFQLPEVTLMVSVYNKKSMKKKEMIGWFSLGQNSSGEEESSHWADMRESKGEEVCRWHVLLES